MPEGVIWKDRRINQKTESGIIEFKGKISVAFLFQTAPIWLLSLEPSMAHNTYLVAIKSLSKLAHHLTINQPDVTL